MSFRCDKCSQEFGSQLALTQHLKDKHSITEPTEVSETIAKSGSISHNVSSAFSKRKKLIFASLAIIVAISLVYFSISKLVVVNSQSVDGIQCNALEGTVMHIHPHLSMIYNNQNLTVPANIGIKSTCLYGLHTHDASGTIHVESPIIANYTLGQFFDIWNKTEPYLPSGKTVFSILNNSTITVYINNTIYNGNYRSVLLKDGEQIKLVLVSR